MKSIFNKLEILAIKLGSHAFLAVLVFILLTLILGDFLFYKYVILIEREEPKIVESNFKFEDNLYRKVLEEWRIKEQKLEKSLSEKYLNPFKAEIIEIKKINQPKIK